MNRIGISLSMMRPILIYGTKSTYIVCDSFLRGRDYFVVKTLDVKIMHAHMRSPSWWTFEYDIHIFMPI